MAILIAIMASLLAIVLIKWVYPRLPAQKRPYFKIVFDELSLFLVPFLLSGTLLFVLYFVFIMLIMNGTMSLVDLSSIESFFDLLEKELGLFEMSAYVLLSVLLILLFLHSVRAIDLLYRQDGFQVSNGLLSRVAVGLGLYRRGFARIQVVLVVLANITFLGTHGGEIRGITTAEIDKGKQGLAGLEVSEDEAVAILVAERLVRDAWNAQPLNIRTRIDALRTKADALRSEIARAETELKADFSKHRRQASDLRQLTQTWRDTAASRTTGLNRRRGRGAQAGTSQVGLGSNAAAYRLQGDYFQASRSEIQAATNLADRLAASTLSQAGDTTSAELTRATVEAAAGALLDPAHISALHALGNDIPILKPVVEAVGGAIHGVAGRLLLNSEHAPVAVVRGGPRWVEAWLKEKANRLRDKLRLASAVGSPTAQRPLVVAERNLTELERDFRRERSALLKLRHERERNRAVGRLRGLLASRLQTVWHERLDVALGISDDRLAVSESKFSNFDQSSLSHIRRTEYRNVLSALGIISQQLPGKYTTDRIVQEAFGTPKVGMTGAKDSLISVTPNISPPNNIREFNRKMSASRNAATVGSFVQRVTSSLTSTRHVEAAIQAAQRIEGAISNSGTANSALLIVVDLAATDPALASSAVAAAAVVLQREIAVSRLSRTSLGQLVRPDPASPNRRPPYRPRPRPAR